MNPSASPTPPAGPAATTEFVTAFNYALDSENRIHAPEAAHLGFQGGLVPGIGVAAYLMRPALRAWGAPWLERGVMRVKFVAPVYDGERIEIVARPPDAGPSFAGLELEARGPDGTLRAVGWAGLAGVPDAPPPDPADFPVTPLPTDELRPLASLATLPPGTMLGTRTLTYDHALARATFLREILASADLDPTPSAALFDAPDGVSHPAFALAQANYVLRDNRRLGPWIHTGSEWRNWGAARDGEPISIRGRVAESFERRGHEQVVLEVAVFGAGGRALQFNRHSAIVRLRGASAGEAAAS